MSPPTLLAWSSQYSNKISIVELESKQEFSKFDGVKLKTSDGIFHFIHINSSLIFISQGSSQVWTHVKEIANTGLLVSVQHCFDSSATLEIFDVSQKGQAKKIFSFEEVCDG